MEDIYKSVFKDDISSYLKVRYLELGRDAFRHCHHVLADFDEYLYGLEIDEKSITFETVEGWISKVHNGVSINTAGQYVHYIRHFLIYLSQCGYKCVIPQNIRAKDSYMPYLYSDDELKRIFLIADSMDAKEPPKNKWVYKEMPMLLRLLYCCGLRVGEALSITVGDINFHNGTILLRVTKKCKQRLVPIHSKLVSQLQSYCEAMGILSDTQAFLFPGADQQSPLSVNSARNYFKIILEKAGITRDGYGKKERGPCLHCLRHTFAVRSFAQNEKVGMRTKDSVPFLSTYLGHDSLYGTEKYLKFSADYFSYPLEQFESFSGELFPKVKYDE